MATFSAVTRQHLLQAIAEYDSRGAENFLGVYGFAPSRDTFVHEGSRYDTPAVLGVAHRYATGRTATAEELAGGKIDATTVLRKRGFDVPAAATSATAASRRGAGTTRGRSTTARSTSPRRPAAPEPAAAICPTCSMTLPATGVCDDCG